jgi:hypothetical protein
MNPESETFFAKRLAARLGREPEVAHNVQARLSLARGRALALRASATPGANRAAPVLLLPRQWLAVAAMAALVLLGGAVHVRTLVEASPADPRAEQAFIDYHVRAESGLASLLAD